MNLGPLEGWETETEAHQEALKAALEAVEAFRSLGEQRMEAGRRWLTGRGSVVERP